MKWISLFLNIYFLPGLDTCISCLVSLLSFALLSFFIIFIIWTPSDSCLNANEVNVGYANCARISIDDYYLIFSNIFLLTPRDNCVAKFIHMPVRVSCKINKRFSQKKQMYIPDHLQNDEWVGLVKSPDKIEVISRTP